MEEPARDHAPPTDSAPEGTDAPEKRPAAERRRRWPLYLLGALTALLALAALEAHTSWLQSRIIASWAREMAYAPAGGPAPDPIVAPEGPYDARLGYAGLAERIEGLRERGFDVLAQTRASDRLREAVDRGLFPIYDEKDRAGLTVLDRSGAVLYQARHPETVYPSFSAIPAPVVATLLFIENRELLEPATRYANPAIEWDRLATVGLRFAGRQFGAAGAVAGASTLATQIEKFRHSPEGITRTPADKLQQVTSATVRAYADGRETLAARRRIVLDYVNSVPLAAVPGYGEVIGLQDGLRAWFGRDPDRVNRLLGGCEAPGDPPATGGDDAGGTGSGEVCEAPGGESAGGAGAERGEALRAVLSLMLAQRRPTFYLGSDAGREALLRLGDIYLDLLAEENVLPKPLIEEARASRLLALGRSPAPPPVPFVERKAATSLRTHLLGLTGAAGFYDLDRLDLSVASTVDRAVQDSVTRLLLRLGDPDFVRRAGLADGRLLGVGDPAKVVYSVVIHERTPAGNVVRVQTDNFDGPFDLNQSSRLELGSTAKLRTLVTYLEIVERLHREVSGLDADARRALADSLPDPLTRWGLDVIARRPGITLSDMLVFAMDRTYSGNPGERFFTGGGSHVFNNFDRTFDGSVLTVRAGFRHSVNLVFVRLMRDIERFFRWRVPGASAHILDDPGDPRRQAYLDRFVDREGRIFVSRFHAEYAGKARDEILQSLTDGRRMSARRLAWTFRSVLPDAPFEEFERFVRPRAPEGSLAEEPLRELYRRTETGHLSLADQGYLASIHPLEVWVARFLIERPEATRAEAVAASEEARRDVYRWLFSPRRRQAQDRSISVILEIEAFLEIERAWRRLGYPFENVVPSLGSSIGSSGDRPGALAELVGILLNDGLRYPLARIDWLSFAEDTPYETLVARRPATGERVLSAEVAAVAREAMLDVVREGTARSIQGAVRDRAGELIAIGGKTGTGDNRFRVFGVGGRLLETRTLNRTATFVFFLGDRHYGVVTAHVAGEDAGQYRFTSSLPVRVLRLMAPYLEQLSL